jgi:hypothetical protein
MLEDRPVHVPDVLPEDVIKISHRLMQVEAKDEPDWRHELADIE